MKKSSILISTLMSANLAFSMASPVFALNTNTAKEITVEANDGQVHTFVDVEEKHWFSDHVTDAARLGLMTGTPETQTFNPYDSMNRAMVATVLHRAYGTPEPSKSVTEYFPDVKDGQWYSKAIAWAAETGVVNGYETGEFAPFDNITREQMAVMIVNYLDFIGYNTKSDADISHFKDLDTVTYGEYALKFCVEHGIIEGKDEGTRVDANGHATRAESAKIILFGHLIEELGTYTDEMIQEHLKAEMESGYAELGKYKVELLDDKVWHLDEGTAAVPGGATDILGNNNNPSSIYLVPGEEEVLIVDAGNGINDKYAVRKNWNEKAVRNIIEAIVGDKDVKFVFTHSHGDHTGLMTTPEVFRNINVTELYIHENDAQAASRALAAWQDKLHTLKDNEIVTVDGVEYTAASLKGHTPGSIALYNIENKICFTGDSMGSGYVWLFWNAQSDPIGQMEKDLNALTGIISEMGQGVTIAAGHRWQQFYENDPVAPRNMSIQYLNDMLKVISGLKDGSTLKSAYADRGNETDLILSTVGCKARICTTPEIIEAYLAAQNAKADPYGWQVNKGNTLSIETNNSQNKAIFMVYADGAMSREEAEKYLDDMGITDIISNSASQAIVMQPKNGESWSEEDVANFMGYLDNIIYITANLKLVGIGNGATFINNELKDKTWMVSGMYLNGGTSDGVAGKYAVPVALSNVDENTIAQYAAQNGIAEVPAKGEIAQNPENRFEELYLMEDVDVVEGFAQAWANTLGAYGRIGNYTDEEGGIGTWYSTPVTKERPFQFFDSVDVITNMNRVTVVQDLNGNGQDSLWYEYLPDETLDAEEGTVPVVVLMHGNTNDPRTQYETSGWANVASEEGIILICPEWQGHVFQGVEYEQMTEDRNASPNSDFIKMMHIVMDKYPQIDQSRIYVSGLSAGSRNTMNLGISAPDLFAAGAGHSGYWDATDISRELAYANAEDYDFPITLFCGDKDENMTTAWDTLEENAGLRTLQGYQILNDMEVTTVEDLSEEFIDLYSIPWTTYGTVENEGICEIISGSVENDKGVKIQMNRIKGWGHWNYGPAAKLMWDFMKDYTREIKGGEVIEDPVDDLVPGVTVSENTDFTETTPDAAYQAAFVYDPSGEEGEIVSVSLVGDFQFHTDDQIDAYLDDYSEELAAAMTYQEYDVPDYSVYEYKKGMFRTGYSTEMGVTGINYLEIPLEKHGSLWSATIPLPGGLYSYDYTITFADGTSKTVMDPANLPFSLNGYDCKHSFICVGETENALAGDEYVFPRTDGQTGTVEYADFTNVDGETETIGVYLPYGYSEEAEPYKVLYLSHGGGGNELQWFTNGAAGHIFDNLTAQGVVEPTVIVTMNNQIHNFESGNSSENIVNAIIPFVEEHYNVVTDRSGRAMAGLSSGASTTLDLAWNWNDTFDYYGIWSPSRIPGFDEMTEEKATELKEASLYHVSCGNYDLFLRRDADQGVYNKLKDAGTNAIFSWHNGAHDWGVWRAQLSEFASEYLWK